MKKNCSSTATTYRRPIAVRSPRLSPLRWILICTKWNPRAAICPTSPDVSVGHGRSICTCVTGVTPRGRAGPALRPLRRICACLLNRGGVHDEPPRRTPSIGGVRTEKRMRMNYSVLLFRQKGFVSLVKNPSAFPKNKCDTGCQHNS